MVRHTRLAPRETHLLRQVLPYGTEAVRHEIVNAQNTWGGRMMCENCLQVVEEDVATRVYQLTVLAASRCEFVQSVRDAVHLF
jgi:hypothetical protein